MSTATTSWSHLPPEITNAIVRFLPSVGGKCSALATVCRVWKAILEPHNFAEITLTPKRLYHPETHRILWRRRGQICYIWFRVEFCPYQCSRHAFLDHDDILDHLNDKCFVFSFQALFNALSKWEPRGDLVLDISVFSSSDNQHHFKYLDFRSDRNLNEPPPPSVHDPAHGWVEPGCHVCAPLIIGQHDFGLANVHGQLFSGPDILSTIRLFEAVLQSTYFPDFLSEIQWWLSLPLVPVVGTILLRQQSRRRWRQGSLICMFTRFPRLQRVCYEPWRQILSMESLFDAYTEILLGAFTWLNIRELTIFENFNETSPVLYVGTMAPREPSLRVSQKLARVSLQLTKLSASYLTDASYFFAACDEAWTWERLTCLTLNARTLSNDTDLSDINDFLRAAASAAMKMPMLETMEIWNGRKDVAIMFRYQRAEDKAIITLRGNSNLPLEPATKQAWEVVAHRHGRIKVVVRRSLILVQVRGHGEAIRLLGLSSEVIRPVSLQQIIRYNKYTW